MDPQALILLGKISNRLDELNGTTAGPIVYSMGAPNSIPKYNTATSLTPSNIVDDGTTVTITIPIIATSFSIPGGLPTQFLKADGSLDSSVYITAADVVIPPHNSLTGLQGGRPGEYNHLDNSQLSRILDLIYVNSVNSLTMLTAVSEKGVSTAVNLQYNIKTNDDVFTNATINQGVGSVLSGINLGNQTKAAGNFLATTVFTLSMDYIRKGVPTNETKTATYTAVVPKWSNVSNLDIINTYALCVANLGTKILTTATAMTNTGSANNQYIWFISTISTSQIFDGNNFSQSIGALNVEDGVSEFYRKSFVITLQDSTTSTMYSYRTRTLKTFSGNIYRIT